MHVVSFDRASALQEAFLTKFNVIVQNLKPLYTIPDLIDYEKLETRKPQPQRAGLAVELTTDDIDDDTLTQQTAEAFGELLTDILLKFHVNRSKGKKPVKYSAGLNAKGAAMRTVQLSNKEPEGNLRLMSLKYFYEVWTKENDTSQLQFDSPNKCLKIIYDSDDQLYWIISPLIKGDIHYSSTETLNFLQWHLPKVERGVNEKYPTYEFTTRWLIY